MDVATKAVVIETPLALTFADRDALLAGPGAKR